MKSLFLHSLSVPTPTPQQDLPAHLLHLRSPESHLIRWIWSDFNFPSAGEGSVVTVWALVKWTKAQTQLQASITVTGSLLQSVGLSYYTLKTFLQKCPEYYSSSGLVLIIQFHSNRLERPWCYVKFCPLTFLAIQYIQESLEWNITLGLAFMWKELMLICFRL